MSSGHAGWRLHWGRRRPSWAAGPASPLWRAGGPGAPATAPVQGRQTGGAVRRVGCGWPCRAGGGCRAEGGDRARGGGPVGCRWLCRAGAAMLGRRPSGQLPSGFRLETTSIESDFWNWEMWRCCCSPSPDASAHAPSLPTERAKCLCTRPPVYPFCVAIKSARFTLVFYSIVHLSVFV